MGAEEEVVAEHPEPEGAGEVVAGHLEPEGVGGHRHSEGVHNLFSTIKAKVHNISYKTR